MKYLFFSMLLGAGLMFYITSGQGKNVLAGMPSLNTGNPSSTNTHGAGESTAAQDEDDEPTQHMVQIHGKWYRYRADNTYMIDGVPTLHITKKPEVAKAPSKNATTTALANKPNANLEKSQKLAKMAGENPLSVYTPEGFQALKDGLEAATNSANERKKALEELSELAP
jgi:hypothetical protein